MDLEQLQKRIEWLEGERRKDKAIIDTLEQRLASLEAGLPDVQSKVKELEGEVSRLSTLSTRFDQIDAAILQVRSEFTRTIENIERLRAEYNRDMEKVRQDDLDTFNRAIGELRKNIEILPELRKNLQARVEEDFRLSRLIEELEVKLVESRRSEEEYRRAQKLIEEAQKQETKRMTGLQGEVSAIRKRLEELRGKVELLSDGSRKLETRLTEIQTAESERRQAQTAFIDKVNMMQVERERIWKDWQSRFEAIERLAQGLDTQAQALDSTHRAVKRAQEAFEEITQKFERRINEITEMQRLTEERFRQEWMTFRADDQKRWTNYTLVQEEQLRENARQNERIQDQLTALQDALQDINDTLHNITQETQKRLQTLLALAHQWMEEYDRTFGRGG